MTPRLKKFLTIPGILAGIVLMTWVWFRMTYPYGPSNCRADVIGTSLVRYAKEHGGWFPHGNRTPEGSLSVLCKNAPAMLDLVRGKTIPLKVAQAAWNKDGQLDPDSCGWNYIEGLRADDDPALILVWDKPLGLDSYGERHRGLAHEIIHVDGSSTLITIEDWPGYILGQRAKLLKLIAARGSNGVPVRWSDEITLGTNLMIKAQANDFR